MAAAADLPMPDLQSLVADILPALTERWVRAGQRAAWRSWRDDPKGMGARFDRRLQSSLYKFSDRKPSRNRSVLDYVYTGAFRRSLAKRNPTRGRDPGGAIATRFSIFGGVLNALGQDRMRGVTARREIVESTTMQFPASTRRLPSGQTVPVAGFTRTQHVRRTEWTHAAQTYAQEWAFRPFELADVKARADAEITARFRRSALRRVGGRLVLRDSVRADWRGREAA